MNLDLKKKTELYTIYKKRKPNGKFRTIYAPCEELKAVQKKCCRLISRKFEPSEFAFGFISGRSSADAAKLHINKDWVISIDIEDFFPTVTYDMLVKNGVSKLIADIATLDGKMVQGSPCSPILSNLILDKFDRHVGITMKVNGISYTRYADDITLSGFGQPKHEYVNFIKELLEELGFKVNKKKTKFMFQNQEMKVLGITVNSDVSINHKTRKALKNKIKYEGCTDEDSGYLAYINSVNKRQFLKLKSQI